MGTVYSPVHAAADFANVLQNRVVLRFFWLKWKGQGVVSKRQISVPVVETDRVERHSDLSCHAAKFRGP